jgi:hypothetical protein
VTSLLETIEARLDDLLQGVADGYDAPPGPRLRLEGLCEAAVIAGAATAGELDRLIEERRRDILGASFAEVLGPDWRKHHPFPELPLFMERAPVVPSTSL